MAANLGGGLFSNIFHHPESNLGGGFKYFSFSLLFGEDSHFDEYFSNGWFNHQLEIGK